TETRAESSSGFDSNFRSGGFAPGTPPLKLRRCPPWLGEGGTLNTRPRRSLGGGGPGGAWLARAAYPRGLPAPPRSPRALLWAGPERVHPFRPFFFRGLALYPAVMGSH